MCRQTFQRSQGVCERLRALLNGFFSSLDPVGPVVLSVLLYGCYRKPGAEETSTGAHGHKAEACHSTGRPHWA